MMPLEFKEIFQIGDEERRYFFSIFRLLRKNKLNLLEEDKTEKLHNLRFFFRLASSQCRAHLDQSYILDMTLIRRRKKTLVFYLVTKIIAVLVLQEKSKAVISLTFALAMASITSRVG